MEVKCHLTLVEVITLISYKRGFYLKDRKFLELQTWWLLYFLHQFSSARFITIYLRCNRPMSLNNLASQHVFSSLSLNVDTPQAAARLCQTCRWSAWVRPSEAATSAPYPSTITPTCPLTGMWTTCMVARHCLFCLMPEVSVQLDHIQVDHCPLTRISFVSLSFHSFLFRVCHSLTNIWHLNQERSEFRALKCHLSLLHLTVKIHLPEWYFC